VPFARFLPIKFYCEPVNLFEWISCSPFFKNIWSIYIYTYIRSFTVYLDSWEAGTLNAYEYSSIFLMSAVVQLPVRRTSTRYSACKDATSTCSTCTSTLVPSINLVEEIFCSISSIAGSYILVTNATVMNGITCYI
jgi:hypothetical protein